MKIQKIYFFILILCQLPALATGQQKDPLNSPSWDLMHQKMLNNGPVVFDNKIKLSTPDFAEDPMNVPVSVRANGLDDIEEIVVFADLNPIQKVLRFTPVHIKVYLSFRIKVEQATPVRAAARTADGIWHVGGRWLEASGGGCTAPSVGRVAGNWDETLMNVSSRIWRHDSESGRLRFRIMHPMDTGLANGIPEFYLEHLDLLDANGALLAKIETYQPVSENPVFTLEIYKDVKTPINLSGSDNNGNRLEASISK